MISTTGNVIDYSFALKTAAAYLGIPSENISYDQPSQSLIITPEKEEGYAIGIETGEVLPLTYVAKEESFATMSFWKIIAEEVDAAVFKDKIVVIGITAELFHDIYQTPLGLMPGVLLNANEILMYVTKTFTKKVYPPVILLIQMLLAVIVFVITYRAGLAKGFSALLASLIIAFSVKTYLLFHNVYFDFFGIFFAGISSYIITYSYKSIGLLIDNAILRREATIDTLTGLYVYRYFEVKLRSEFKRAKEIGNRELTLIICDIDNFKSINDTHGHEGGNAVLKDLAKVLNKFSRRGDAICRYGGEEFCFILPQATKEGALEYAERSRKAIEEHDFVIPKGGPLKITASFGIALMEDDVPDSAALIKRADSALYDAKRAGKNKAIIFSKATE
jgi:diguanylate cyclase (GGDEF)-like protein